jgi:YkoY family integral membrane protein
VPFDFEAADLVTILLLIILEGLLSADNALVMAVMILGLPREQHSRALKYGLVGAFVFRIIATLLATYLINVAIVKLGGGLYLLYLTYMHFMRESAGEEGTGAPEAKPAFGLSAFWATVVRVEVMNLAFSIDSILAAVALSNKTWVVVTGGLLGIVALRIVVGQLIELIKRYPALVDGAFIIVAWVGIKLVSEYAHQVHWIGWEISRSVSLGIIVVIFVASYLYARRKGPAT